MFGSVNGHHIVHSCPRMARILLLVYSSSFGTVAFSPFMSGRVKLSDMFPSIPRPSLHFSISRRPSQTLRSRNIIRFCLSLSTSTIKVIPCRLNGALHDDVRGLPAISVAGTKAQEYRSCAMCLLFRAAPRLSGTGFVEKWQQAERVLLAHTVRQDVQLDRNQQRPGE
ncbi:hypothetical protein B0T13DRAFT_276567 [Neurospora crassa]|nr:hypothetical protein B0T13DRAFT_276567 [Neurospora crassa]